VSAARFDNCIAAHPCLPHGFLSSHPHLPSPPAVARQKLLKPLLDRAEHKLSGLPKGQSRWLALTLFVGVPAPGTGGWTGVVIAYLLSMSFAEAMSSVTAGVMLAGVIMTILTLAGKVGALIALAMLVVTGVGAIVSAKKE
jgi:VIT1/CCC1 family predicted Fe2+/Mn2+ transporter